MARSSTAEELGMLPKNDERPPFFAFAVSLYRSDLLFRGLVDLAVSGFVILAFTGGFAAAWKPVKSALNSLNSAISRPTNEIRVSGTPQFTAAIRGPGSETVLAIAPPQIPDRCY